MKTFFHFRMRLLTITFMLCALVFTPTATALAASSPDAGAAVSSAAMNFITTAVIGAVNAGEVLPSVPTGNNALQAKEVCIHIFHKCLLPSLDNMAIIIMRIVVNKLSDATVNYINNGFEGRENGAGFPLDLEKTFINAGDAVAGMVIDQAVGANGSLCEPFRAQLNIALRSNANINSQKSSDDFVGSCPLTSIVKNGEAGINNFLSGDFINEGGWDTWYAMTQDPLGNPYSSLFTIQADIDSRQAKAAGIQKEQLGWAKGFLSSQDCIKKSPVDATKCVEWGPVKTPGSVLEAHLQKTLGSQVDQLNVASNFNQIVTALVGQLEKLVISKASGLFNDEAANDNYNFNSQNSGGANGQLLGSCSASKLSVLVGDPVVWTGVGAGTEQDTTYRWEGEGIPPNTTSKSVTVVYDTSGSKKPTLYITQILPGQTVERTLTVDCLNPVKVSKYTPLAITCMPDKFNVPALGFARVGTSVTPDNTVLWTFTIRGGSGQLSSIYTHDWAGEKKDNVIDDRVSQTLIPDFSPATGILTYDPDQGVLVKVLVSYGLVGSKSITLDVADKDPFVDPGTLRCSGVTAYKPGSN